MSIKKRKITLEPVFDIIKTKIAIQIVEFHPKTKEWLVEWRDKTRTWENYDTIKDQAAFRDMVEKNLQVKRCYASYIT